MKISKNQKFNAALVSLYVGLAVFVAKTIAYLITESSAIFSDTAESVIHILATLMVVYSIYLSNKPPDKSHFYGHGNVEYFSAGVEGFLIIIAALSIMYFAIRDLVIGPRPDNLDTGTIIIAAAGLVNLVLGLYMIREGKKTNSLALVADGKHILTDAFTSLGVVVGLILILFTGYLLLDPIIALIVAANIIVTGIKLIRSSIGELMNETDEKQLNKLVNKLLSIKREHWIDVHHLRFWTSADRMFIDFHLTLPYYYSIKDSHDEEEYISNKLNSVFPHSDLRVHMDFCTNSLCKFCKYESCKVREDAQEYEIDWTVDKLIGDPVNASDHIT